MDEMQYLISFLLLRVEKRLIHYSYEKVEPFIITKKSRCSQEMFPKQST